MFSGSIVALVTPMQKDGAIDYANFEKLIQRQIEQGSNGIVVLGTTGEAATIELDERAALIKLALQVARKKIPVIIGTGTNSTKQSLGLTQQALDLGADATLIVTPYYNKPTQEGLYQHYALIAKTVSIPQILYNVPGRTGCDLLPETVARLSGFSNIIGLKEASTDKNRLEKLKALDISMRFFSGNDDSAMQFILDGGKGVISVAANVAPNLMAQLTAAALKKDHEAAEKLNKQLEALYAALFLESNPIPTKWALEKMGFIQSGIRLPLTTLNQAHHASVESALRSAHLY